MFISAYHMKQLPQLLYRTTHYSATVWFDLFDLIGLVFDMLERAFSGTGVEFRFSARKETVGSLSGNVPYVEIFNQ